MRTRIRRRAVADIDPAYLDWIRTLRCIVCFLSSWVAFVDRGDDGVVRSGVRYEGALDAQCWPTEAAHVGNRGLGQKCPDQQTVPLCKVHHTEGRDAHHVLGRKFWEYHGLDRDALLSELQARYELERNGVAG